MAEFYDYLKTAFESNFVQGEYNEDVRSLYKILAGGVRLQADMLAITNTDIILSKKSIAVWRKDLSWPKQLGMQAAEYGGFGAGYRQASLTMLKHDARLRQYLQLVEETPEVVRFSILLDASARPRSLLNAS